MKTISQFANILKMSLVSSISALMACGTWVGNPKSGDGGSGGGPKVNSEVVADSSATLRLSDEANEFGLFANQNLGQASATGLKGLKYYISGISICQGMSLSSGTAYGDLKNCIAIYTPETNPDPRYAYDSKSDYNTMGNTARSNTDGFIDLMDATSRAKLNKSTSITKENIGDYNYGIITWYPVVKMTAEIAIGGSPTGYFRTSDGTSSNSNGYLTTFSGDFSKVETAAEAVVVLGNGGNWFKFQKPLSITQADIDANTEFALDLTFNPDGLVKAYAAGYGDGCGTCTLKDTVANPVNVNSSAGNLFTPPSQIALIPIAHKSDDSVMKEVYLGSVEGTNSEGSDAFDLRVELYYLKSDAAKSIYGAEVHTLINANTTSFVNNFAKISEVSVAADGAVDLKKFDGQTVLTSLTRKTTVGETTTATIKCSDLNAGGFTFKGCAGKAGDATSKDVTLTLKSVRALK